MFCPNCGAQNDPAPHYCRMCGLKLDSIALELTLQNPSDEVAALLRKKKWLEFLGKSALSISGVIGLCLVLTVAVIYKLALLGPKILFGSAIAALVFFLLASLCFFAYSRFFLNLDRVAPDSREPRQMATPTDKLLDDPTFEPASVV